MSTLRLTTISNQSGSATVPSETVINGSAKAWVNLNAETGTPVIRASFNVSSITDLGVGDYAVNFTNALVDANYVISCLSWQTAGNTVVNIGKNSNRTDTASLVNIMCVQAATRFDGLYVSVSIFR
jgi:hypothetical protein